jgi:hypothetical protein
MERAKVVNRFAETSRSCGNAVADPVRVEGSIVRVRSDDGKRRQAEAESLREYPR